MYVINGIPEFRKNRNRNSDFRLERFQVFRFAFPPESSGIQNSEAEFRIPVVPGSGIPKSEFPTKKHIPWPRGRGLANDKTFRLTTKHQLESTIRLPLSLGRLRTLLFESDTDNKKRFLSIKINEKCVNSLRPVDAYMRPLIF
jgi:hypothetical protein